MKPSAIALPEDDLARFFHLSRELLVIIDQNAKIQRANPALCDLLQRNEQELIDAELSQLMKEEDIETTKALSKGMYTGLDLLNYKTDLVQKNGSIVSVAWRCTPIQGSTNRVYAIGKICSGINQQHSREIRLSNANSPAAIYDRKHFEQELINYFEQFKVSGESFALLFVDIDNFTPINDYLGENAGDKVLEIIAARIMRCVRDCDSVSRYGGDEFAMIVHRNTTDSIETEITPLANRILNCIAQPIEILGEHISISASLGISYPTEKCDNPQELLDQADLAMTTAKSNGGNQSSVAKSNTTGYQRRRVSPISMYA